MPTLTIDNREITVPDGTKVIDAAERLGIMIPRFCYHPALGAVGACRVCAVKFLEGPRTGILMSCMVDAADGMVVSTTDPEAVDFRRHVIEWLMINHPHDCPVCDEGGHCLLQDMTVSGGHGIRRYRGAKRTHRDQSLGPLVQHEMNRCIQCYRCVRFYREVAGGHDLGVMGIGSRVFYGRFREGALESPFSGNLIDICPTGVFTDKPSRYMGRRWDFQRSPSLCISCSLMCHTVASARYRQVVRQEARYSDSVNGYFICDRGRYSHAYGNADNRPRRALLRGRPVTVEEAVFKARDVIGTVSRAYGSEAVAGLGGFRSSLENQAALAALCRRQGWSGPIFWADADAARKSTDIYHGLRKDLAMTLRDVESADTVLVFGVDPLNEAPMLAMAMRRAVRNGARVAVLDPRPVSLPFDFDHFPLTSTRLLPVVEGLTAAVADTSHAAVLGPRAAEYLAAIPDVDESLRAVVDAISPWLIGSRRPALIGGLEGGSRQLPARIVDLTWLMNTGDCRPGMMFVTDGAHGIGAAMLSNGTGAVSEMLTDIENGRVRALVAVESDWLVHYPDRRRMRDALERLDALVVLDFLDAPLLAAADVFLPTTTLYEDNGVYINNSARAFRAVRVHTGGESIARSGGGDHPPRHFTTQLPGAGPMPAWQLLSAIADATPAPIRWMGANELLDRVDTVYPAAALVLKMADFGEAGGFVGMGEDDTRRFSPVAEETPMVDNEGEIEVIVAHRLLGTDVLSTRSAPLREAMGEPLAFLHPQDAAALNCRDGEPIDLEIDGGRISIRLQTVGQMARRTLVLPRDGRIDWQSLGATTRRLPADCIHPSKKDGGS